jgi:hypothetical protein
MAGGHHQRSRCPVAVDRTQPLGKACCPEPPDLPAPHLGGFNKIEAVCG